MTLAQRIKKGLTKMIPENKISYTATPVQKPKKVLIGVKKSQPQQTIKQYGDKGYKPSTGKRVGY